MRKLALCSAVLLCVGVIPALALSDKPYLNANDADFGNLLPPPPADGSAMDKRDMQTVLELQKEVTPERLALIQADTEQSVYAWQRCGDGVDDIVVVVANCTPVPRDHYRVGVAHHQRWRCIANSDDKRFGGSGYAIADTVRSRHIPWQNRPLSCDITLPPLSIVMYAPQSQGDQQ